MNIEWTSWLAEAPDLDAVKAALVREAVIRETMAKSGEPRQIVTDMIDAWDSMGRESVLELTDGEPTTLADALSYYIDSLENNAHTGDLADVASDLHAILSFPYSGEEALIQLHTDPSTDFTIEEDLDDGRGSLIKIGGVTVARTDWERAGSDGVALAEEIAVAVHRAVLARVIPDRPHQVQLTSSDRRSLLAWLERPRGTWRPDSPSRFSVTDFQGTSLIVRTWPYAWPPAPVTARPV